MSLLVTLIAMHANRFDKAGNERLIEKRAHMDCGPESPFELREQNSPPPDVQAQETKSASLDSSNSHHRK